MSDPKTSRTATLLLASVVINALLIGFVFGGGLADRRGGDRPHQGGAPGPGGEMGFVRLIERYAPSEERVGIRKGLREAFVESGQQRRAVARARREFVELILADPFDAAAATETLARLRREESGATGRLHEELVEQLSKLTAEQRREVVEGMRRRARGGERGLPPGDHTRRPPNQ
ncbi:MAG: periplasmic heavy metal sensor [Pseudomonadota bacterium]